MAAELQELMTRYTNGDKDAFRELYQQISPRLLGFLLGLTGDRARAEDLLQITFLKVHRARSSYVAGANPIPWIFAIARRSFLDEVRKRKRRRDRASPESAPEPRATLQGEPEEDTREPIDVELKEAALEALSRLPPSQREAVVLTKLSGKSIAEAAEIAGTTQGAMKLRAHRGYVALRKALAAEGA